jgi:hypothetical protein
VVGALLIAWAPVIVGVAIVTWQGLTWRLGVASALSAVVTTLALGAEAMVSWVIKETLDSLELQCIRRGDWGAVRFQVEEDTRDVWALRRVLPSMILGAGLCTTLVVWSIAQTDFPVPIEVLMFVQVVVAGAVLVPAATRFYPMAKVVRFLVRELPPASSAAVIAGFPGMTRTARSVSLLALYVGSAAAAGIGARLVLPESAPMWLAVAFAVTGSGVAIAAWLGPIVALRKRLRRDKHIVLREQVRLLTEAVDGRAGSIGELVTRVHGADAAREVRIPWITAAPPIVGVALQVFPLAFKLAT